MTHVSLVAGCGRSTDAGAALETLQRSSAGGIEFAARAGRALVLNPSRITQVY